MEQYRIRIRSVRTADRKRQNKEETMKRKWQVPVSIILYILILAAALDFNLLRLIDIRLFLLLMVGTTVLTVPFYERNMNRRELRYVFGKKLRTGKRF